MNFRNEQIRCLQRTIIQYEKMSMFSEGSSEKWEYMRKAEQCRNELKKLLGNEVY